MLGRAIVVAAGSLLIAGAADAQAPAPKSKVVAKAPAQSSDPKPSAEPDPLTPAEATNGPLAAPGAPTASVAAPASPPSDVVLEVRRRLAGTAASPARNLSGEAADRAALVAFYDSDFARAMWTGSTSLGARGTLVMQEIRKADDWGLKSSQFDLPGSPSGEMSTDALADAEIRIGLAVLKYARHARGGRLDPQSLSKMIDRKPRLYDPASLIRAIAATESPDAYLRDLHPRHQQFRNLQKALVALRAPPPAAAAPEPAGPPQIDIPSGPRLKPGDRHPHVVLVRMRLGIDAAPGSEAIYDDALVKAVRAHQSERGQQANGVIGPETRRSLSAGTSSRTASAAGPRDKADVIQRLIVNMERWRWMPDDLGDIHVWNNIPEQMSKVMKNGKAVFHERIVVGKPSTPTPNFSADMQFVIFQPEWGVPSGIKNNEIAPMLRSASNNSSWFFDNGRTPSSVLARYGLRVSQGNQIINPDSINWSQVDINRFNFVQPAGARNVLGVVKFRFPNKHDVYMHDTPERHLFSSGLRAFSHGCMRVQNPVRLAEVLLEHDRGWSADHVRSMVPRGGEVKLTRQIPVHNVYFTAMADDDGKLHYAADVYGMDSRVASALEGRSVAIASRSEPVTGGTRTASSAGGETPAARVRGDRQARVAARRSSSNAGNTGFNPFAGLFGN